jgi:hypothetical protein
MGIPAFQSFLWVILVDNNDDVRQEKHVTFLHFSISKSENQRAEKTDSGRNVVACCVVVIVIDLR